MAEEGILLETRRLLNSLNEENSQLRERNHNLQEALRDTESQLGASRREKESLEKDMKQINLNLMQQLQLKSNAVKNLQNALNEETTKLKTALQHLSSTKSSMSSAETDLESTRHEMLQFEKKLAECKRENASLKEEISSRKEELARSTATSKEADLLNQQEHNAQIVKLRSEISAMHDELHHAKSQLTSLEETHTETKASHAREIARLNAEAQRTQHAESEVRYTHDQMHATASTIVQYLGDVQSRVRALARDCEENDAVFHAAVHKCQEQQTAMNAFKSCDESVMKITAAHIEALEQQSDDASREVRDAKSEKEQMHYRVRELENQLRDAEWQIQDMTRGLTQRTEEIAELMKNSGVSDTKLKCLQTEFAEVSQAHATTKAELTEAVSQVTSLKEQVHSLELNGATLRGAAQEESARLRNDMKLLQEAQREEASRWAEVEAAYEEEVFHLKGQLDEHTATLSAALGRITNNTAASTSMPRRHRSSSSFAGSVDRGPQQHQTLPPRPAPTPSTRSRVSPSSPSSLEGESPDTTIYATEECDTTTLSSQHQRKSSALEAHLLSVLNRPT